MDVVEERCGGADLGKTDVKVCIRVPGAGKRARWGSSAIGVRCPLQGPVHDVQSYVASARPSVRWLTRSAPRSPLLPLVTSDRTACLYVLLRSVGISFGVLREGD